jgi:hypothetical protein
MYAHTPELNWTVKFIGGMRPLDRFLLWNKEQAEICAAECAPVHNKFL